MAKRVILAKAGSGKTYKICQEVNPEKRNLIIAYTNRNVKNLQNELALANKCHVNTKVITFDKFLIDYFLYPYEPLIFRHFHEKKTLFGLIPFKTDSVTIKEPEPQRKNNKANPYYIKDKDLRHYLNPYLKRYYCSRISKLLLKIKNGKTYNLVKIASCHINNHFDYLYVDEFQDFREQNYEILFEIIKHINNVLLVGDYYQHSVNGTNNSGKPFSIRKDSNGNLKHINYDDYCNKLVDIHNIEVDDTSLTDTRRCPKTICDFINQKLLINIGCNNNNKGEIVFLNTLTDINNILDDDNIVKLVTEKYQSYKFNALTWGISKGDTYESVCIILTNPFENFDSDDFDITKTTISNGLEKNMFSQITINRMYVAITRTKGNLYFIKKSLFDKVKNNYLKD